MQRVYQPQDLAEAQLLRLQSKELQEAGAAMLVLEMVPAALAASITQDLQHCHTIGIGAGESTDGQVLVLHDVLGLNGGKIPPFAKKFANIFEIGVQGISDYIQSIAKK